MNIYDLINPSPEEKPLDNIVTDGGMVSIFKTIAVIGDSLSSGTAETLTDDDVIGYPDMLEYSWPQLMAASAGTKVYNFTRGGMSSKIYNDTFADDRGFWNPELKAHAYVIALGVNDLWNDKIPHGTSADIDLADWRNNGDSFFGHYARIIQRYKEIQPRAKFFLTTVGRKDEPLWDEFAAAHRRYVTEICSMFDNCYLIDIYTYMPPHDAAYREKYYIGGHFTAAGYVIAARAMESYIDYIIRHNPEDFKHVPFIGTDMYYKTVKDSYRP